MYFPSNCCWQELHLQALSILGGSGCLEPPTTGNQQYAAQSQWPLLRTLVLVAPLQQQGGVLAPLPTGLCCAATGKQEAQRASPLQAALVPHGTWPFPPAP